MSTHGFKIHARPASTVSDALLARYAGFPVANISDVMSRTTGTSNLRPMHAGGGLVGRALTVRTRPGDNLMVHKAIDVAGPGDVIVVDAGGVGPNAIIGEIMASLAAHKKIAGIVIDGLIRDSDTLKKGSWPVYARGVAHRGPYKDGPGELHVSVVVDGMVVHPGDIIVGDGDGLLAVPPAEAEAIAKLVEAVQVKEAAILKGIAEGRADRAWVDASLRDKGVL